jgi:hypothetical protein
MVAWAVGSFVVTHEKDGNAMTLRPTDMLEIQSAIDEYERKFPGRAAPSAEDALAWRLGKREAAKFLATVGDEQSVSTKGEKSELEFEEQECSRLAWAWEQITLRWQIWTAPKDDDSESASGMLPWVKGVLLVGWWGVVAVVVASVFFFGALVGGLK